MRPIKSGIFNFGFVTYNFRSRQMNFGHGKWWDAKGNEDKLCDSYIHIELVYFGPMHVEQTMKPSNMFVTVTLLLACLAQSNAVLNYIVFAHLFFSLLHGPPRHFEREKCTRRPSDILWMDNNDNLAFFICPNSARSKRCMQITIILGIGVERVDLPRRNANINFAAKRVTTNNVI